MSSRKQQGIVIAGSGAGEVRSSGPDAAACGLPRFVEVMCAFVGLVVLSPLLALTAVITVLSSPGPMLFRQKRVGRGGRRFILYKFRTMKVTDSTLRITARDDDRITRTGRFLRKAKLDELPELWNVLKGDMSFVGPRPEAEKYVDLNNHLWREVLAVRPGITDPVTISLRSEEDVLAAVEGDRERFYLESLQPQKLRGYLEYLRDRNGWRDVMVILRTFFVIFFPGRASALARQPGPRLDTAATNDEHNRRPPGLPEVE